MLDLAELLFGLLDSNRSSHTQIDEIAERFDIDISDTFQTGSSAAETRFKALVRNVNGTGKLIPMVSWFVERVLPGNEDEETKATTLSHLLTPYGYSVDMDDGPRLIPLTASTTSGQRQTNLSWLERHAPRDSIRYLERARDRLAEGDWVDVLTNCRTALEKLTVDGRFSAALDELVTAGVIERGQPDRQKDYELLKSVYGFDSTMGSHGGSSSGVDDRARWGYFATEDAIHFLVTRVKSAIDNGGTIRRWKPPRN